MTKEYATNWNKAFGFTMDQAQRKKNTLDITNKVNDPNSKWNPAEIVLDTSKQSGYKVIVTSK